MKKQSVYIESSVVSYLTSKPSTNIVSLVRQQMTQQFWESEREEFAFFISAFVIDEISRGDADASQRRMKSIDQVPLLYVPDEITLLAEVYYNLFDIPEKARYDTLHLALCVHHKIDFLLTWNMVHLASARIRKSLDDYNIQHSLHIPVICTPEELLGKDYEN